MDTNKRE